jgi:hypothetical protein
MNKLTSNSAILRAEIKSQVEFDLLVAVCRASGMRLHHQKDNEFYKYKHKYIGLNCPESCLQSRNSLCGDYVLISFQDAIFSLAEPSWTHIWQGKISEIFYYGDSEKIYFDISQIKTVPGDLVGKCCSLISTREVAAVAPKFKVGDVIKGKLSETEYTVLYIDEKSAAVERCDGVGRCFIQTSALHNYEKVIPLRTQLISLITSVDDDTYSDDIADAILDKFNVTEKS